MNGARREKWASALMKERHPSCAFLEKYQNFGFFMDYSHCLIIKESDLSSVQNQNRDRSPCLYTLKNIFCADHAEEKN